MKSARIQEDDYEQLQQLKSDTGEPIPIQQSVNSAIQLHLNRRSLNALVVKALHTTNSIEKHELLLEIARTLEIPEEYLK